MISPYKNVLVLFKISRAANLRFPCANKPVIFLSFVVDLSLHKSGLRAPVTSEAELQIKTSILFPFSDPFVKISTEFEKDLSLYPMSQEGKGCKSFRESRCKCVWRLTMLYSSSSDSLCIQVGPDTEVSTLNRPGFPNTWCKFIHILCQWPSHTKLNTQWCFYSSLFQSQIQKINCRKEVLNTVSPYSQGCHCSWVQPVARLSTYSQ